MRTWMAAVLLLAVPSGLRAEQFTYAAPSHGKLVKEGRAWVEYKADGDKLASFSELARTDQVVLLFDPARLMILRLPLAEGEALWTDASAESWNKLAGVTYQP